VSWVISSGVSHLLHVRCMNENVEIWPVQVVIAGMSQLQLGAALMGTLGCFATTAAATAAVQPGI